MDVGAPGIEGSQAAAPPQAFGGADDADCPAQHLVVAQPGIEGGLFFPHDDQVPGILEPVTFGEVAIRTDGDAFGEGRDRLEIIPTDESVA